MGFRRPAFRGDGSGACRAAQCGPAGYGDQQPPFWNAAFVV